MSNDSGSIELTPPAAPAEHGSNRPHWSYTGNFEQDYRNNPLFEERHDPKIGNGDTFFVGRPIIHRDSPINGGVYLMGGNGEAAVVDDLKDAVLRKTYQTFRSLLPKDLSEIKRNALGLAWKLTQEKIPYSQDGINIIHQALGIGADRKIYLGVYIENGAGVCRHQALLTGYLVEKLTKEGILGGKVSVDRNFIKGRGGHAWVRYTNSQGEVFILDPAQEYIGSLKGAPKNGWNYKRPED